MATSSLPQSNNYLDTSRTIPTTPVMENPIINIAPRGDVILICNHSSGPSTKISLRTSSHVLQLGSSVFSAMLGPHFKEGRALAEKGTVEILLPEDDAQAMTTMCKIMHVSPDIMEKVPSGRELTLLAQCADKYNTARALGPATYYWINEAISSKTIAKYMREIMLGAAFTFEHAGLFARIGREIVLQGLGGKSLSIEDCTETLSGLLDQLQELREQLIRTTAKCFDSLLSEHIGDGDGKEGSSASTCGCDFQSMRAVAICRKLRRSKLWPCAATSGVPLDATFQAAKSFNFQFDARSITCAHVTRKGGCGGTRAVSAETMSQIIRDKASVWGVDLNICLKCAKGEGMVPGKVCGHR